MISIFLLWKSTREKVDFVHPDCDNCILTACKKSNTVSLSKISKKYSSKNGQTQPRKQTEFFFNGLIVFSCCRVR